MKLKVRNSTYQAGESNPREMGDILMKGALHNESRHIRGGSWGLVGDPEADEMKAKKVSLPLMAVFAISSLPEPVGPASSWS